MKNTETREISAKIDELHEERGEAALGRVLTLLISTNEASLEHDLEVANSASRNRIVPERGALRKPLKCWPAMDTVGGCRDHYHEEHRNP